MQSSIQDILLQQIAIFDATMDNEKQKKRAILTADGNRITLLTSKTEDLISELNKLEAMRLNGLKTLQTTDNRLPDKPTLNDLEAIIPADILSRYREKAEALQLQLIENKELLESTSGIIHNLLTSMVSTADLYSPAKQSGKKLSSMLVNASA